MMKKTLLGALLLAVVVAVAAVWMVTRQFLGDAVSQRQELYISRNADYAAVRDSLAGAIKRGHAFDIYARRIGLAESFRPGHYVLEPGMSVISVARMLKLGHQTPVRVAIHNLRTPSQLAARLAAKLDADSVAWMSAFTSREVARSVDFDVQTLFAMFLPNTYEFYWTVTPEEFVRRMRTEYDRFWTTERDQLRSGSGLSRLEVVTLASIVAEESLKVDEMPRIAGVYINRLRLGMPLQADPTVKYALQNFELRRIMHHHLKFPSPYNTYLNTGLPPSPICMPSLVAIDAVLGYEKHNYIYFCARPTLDGYHDFASTYAKHQSNARAYSRALDRHNIK